jgi:hypothetical protein
MDTTAQQAVSARLEAMNKSLHTIVHATVPRTRWLANSNFRYSQSWLKQCGIEFYYDGATQSFRLKEDEHTQDSTHTQ